MIDLRSDVLLPPTEAMWEAMRQHTIGWTLTDEDPAVNELQALGASMVGQADALLLPTCGAANLVAALTLGEHGSQIILESMSHMARSEDLNVASIAGLAPRLVDGHYGALDPQAVEAIFVDSQGARLPRISLVCLENTHNNAGGVPLTPAQTRAITDISHRHGAAVHLDGARLFNAAVALNVPVASLGEAVDSVAVSLNKGLSAPWGALLCGSADTIRRARQQAKRLGLTSVHKAGYWAAAGLIALNEMTSQLVDDHARARRLALALAELPGLSIDLTTVQTNIVVVELAAGGVTAHDFTEALKARGVLAYPRPPHRVRFVTHRLIQDADVQQTIETVTEVLRHRSS